MIFVGIDVASKKHDCFLMQDETGLIYSKPFSIDNNEEGYKKLCRHVKKIFEECYKLLETDSSIYWDETDKENAVEI